MKKAYNENALLKIFFICLMFIFEKERDTQSASGEGQRETETQNLKQALGSEVSAQSLTWGLNLTSYEIMT